jgi:hypothetical protein
MRKFFTINGQQKEAIWVEKQGYLDAHWEIDGIQFEGHRIHWSFNYTPKTYLKESELSGNEWRKGGSIKYLKDGIQVYEQFCREPEYAAQRIMETLPKLMDIDWDRIKEGEKIYYDNVPATIGYIMLDQGCFMAKAIEGMRFPKTGYLIDEGEDYEDPTELKVEILSPHIWWFRK